MKLLFSSALLLLSTAAASVLLPAPGPFPHLSRRQNGPQRRAVQTDDFLLQLHRSLVEIPSVTGNELAVTTWLADFLRTQNWTVELQEVVTNRSNILAYPPTVEGGKSRVLLTSHLDTVPPFIPYTIQDANTSNPIIWGRGTNDAKGAVATQIVAAMNVLAREDLNLPDDALALLFVIGEEGLGDGMKFFSNNSPHNYSAVIFGEPTEGNLVCGHKGALGMLLNVTGKAAHSGYPWLGVNANNILVDALSTLIGLEPSLPASEKFGNTTLNVGLVQGGTAINVVPGGASASIAIRLGASTPTELESIFADSLSGTFERAKAAGGDIAIQYPNGYAPIELNCDVEGFNTTIVNYGTDIPNLNGTHKKYLYGPGSILSAHTLNEFVSVVDLLDAVPAYEKIILHALGIEES